MENTHFSHYFWNGPLYDGSNLLLIHGNPLIRYNVTQESDDVHTKCALLQIGIQLLLSQQFKYPPKMHNMILQGLKIDENIVEIYHNTNSDQRLQELGHDPHKSARGICKPECHHKPFKKPIVGFKGCFPFISWSYSNLMVPTL